MYERSRKRQNRRGGHNRGACPVTQENPSADTAPTPEKRRVKKPLIIGVAVVAIAAAAILGMSVFSPQAKADKLYEQGSYAEALEAYEQVRSDNNAAKMSDCRYQLFLGYLLSDGPYKTSQGEVTWTVEGYSNEDIKVLAQRQCRREVLRWFRRTMVHNDSQGRYQRGLLGKLQSEDSR